MTPTAMTATDPADLLTFEVTVTLEDLLALQTSCMASPAMQAGRLRREAAVVLIAAACAPVMVTAGVFIAWAGDRHGQPPGTVLRFLMFDHPGTLVMAVLVMVGCTVGGAVLQRWSLRPRLRRVLRRILRARPDVDLNDPQLAFRAFVTVSDEGVESRSGIGATRVGWNVLKRWAERGEHLMVLGDAMVGFCVRRSAVDPEVLERFRHILSARLGPEEGPSSGTRPGSSIA